MSLSSENEEGVNRALEIVREFNLPALVAGPAGRAISRLIGAAVDVPAAAIENVSSRIRDDARSRSAITNAIAKQAADIAAQDADLVQRSLYRWLGENARKQANREKVANAAAEEIASVQPDAVTEAVEPKSDWMNHFSRLAEDASSEEVQRTWGRVLAGELRKPGSFSLRTLRFISEMDQSTADLFDRKARLVIGGDFLPSPQENTNEALHEKVRLEDAGLIVGASSGFTRTFSGAQNPSGWREGSHTLMIYFSGDEQKFGVSGVLLTNVAKEMLSLVHGVADVPKLENMARAITRSGVSKIELVGPSGTMVIDPQ